MLSTASLLGLNGEDYGWTREGGNVGKYRIVLVDMGKVLVESNKKTVFC